MKKYNLAKSALSLFILISVQSLAGNYTWTGTTNTDWATGTNWSPNGVPSTNDTVTIVTHTNLPVLAANTNIKKITMTSGTLDCNSKTLTISAAATFNGGSINSGTVTCSGTSTITFAGTTFGAAVNATGNNLLFNGSVFNSTLTAVKKGSTSDNGNGGNVFNGTVTLTDSGTGSLVLSNNTSAPDTFNSSLTVSATSTGGVYLAHQGTGNVFNGDVTFSTGNVFSNTYGTAAYNGNITLNSTSGNISFGNNTGSWTLASGKNISIGTFSAGTLTIRGLTQSDNSINMRLALTGTGKLVLGSGNTISAKLYASSNQLTFSGSRFLSPDTLIYTGGNNATSSGGNYFGSSVYIANTYSGTNYHFSIGSTNVDTFTTTTTIATTGNTSLDVANGLFLGAVTLRNSITGTLSERFYVWDCTFKGGLTLDGIYSAIKFKNGTGNSLLDSTATLSLVSGYAGQLTLSYIEQRGSNAINLNMSTNTSSGNNTILSVGPNATFNANFTYLGQRLELNGGTFNGNASFTRFSQQLDVCTGGNVFNGTTLICDSVAASTADRVFKLANTTADDFNGNVTFKQYGTGTSASTMKMYPAYTANSTFAGNVTVESNNVPIEFGGNGGKVILDGNGTQSVTKTGAYNPSIKKLTINKASGNSTLSLPVAITDTLKLTKGIITTDTTNLLTFNAGAVVVGASDSSFVNGPVAKIGNTDFIFPTGKGTKYSPITISSLSSSATFLAEYFHSNPNSSYNISSRDTTLGIVSNCEFWDLKRTSGSTSASVSLSWNSSSCGISHSPNMRVTHWNGTKWTDCGNGSTSGDSIIGTVTSGTALSTFSPFTLGTTILAGSPPTGPHAKFTRGMYVDHFINAFVDVNGNSHIDETYSILGSGTLVGNLYTKEKELLDYCFANHINYLILYDLRTLFAYNYVSNSYGDLEQNLCRFMDAAKTDYCIETFGAAITSQSEFTTIEDYNNNAIAALILSPLEESLINDNDLVNIIEDNTIKYGDSEFDLAQDLRSIISTLRFNAGSGCPDFDVFVTEYEYWNYNNSFNTYKNDLVNILSAAGVYIDAYTRKFSDYANQSTPQAIVDYIDGSVTGNTDRHVGRILSTHYVYQDNLIQHPFNFDTNDKNTFLRQTNTWDYSVIHPLFNSNADEINGTTTNNANFQGFWMIYPYHLSTVPGTPIIKRNIFTNEKYFYDDWRTNINIVPATSISSLTENISKPGASVWFKGSEMVKYFNKPTLLYRSDLNACVTSIDANLIFSYSGPPEVGTHYTFQLKNSGGSVVGGTFSGVVNDIEQNDYSMTANPKVIDDIAISNVPKDDIDPYTAELLLEYKNSDGVTSCGSYLYTETVWVSATPHVILHGDIHAGNNICQEDYVILSASVYASNPSDIVWYRRPLAGVAVSTGRTGPSITLNSYDNAGLSGQYEFYYTIANSNCVTTTSVPETLTINKNPRISPITFDCTVSPGLRGARILTNSPNYPAATYEWCDGSTTNFTQVYAGGRYSVIAIQEGGCTRMATVTVPEAVNLSVSANGGCLYTITENHYGNGQNGNFAWFKYNPGNDTWNTQAGNNFQLVNVSPGYYSCRIVIGSTCMTNQIIVGPAVTEPSTLTNPTCYPHADGSITLGTTSGVINYSWNSVPVQTTANATNLPAGTYTVTVSDGTCSSQATFTLTNSATVPLSITSSTNVTPCHGGSNGTITISASSWTSLYEYSIDNGSTWQSMGTNPFTITGLVANSYSIKVRDANGCESTPISRTITEPSAINPTITASGGLTFCAGGSVTLTAHPNAGVTYLWYQGISSIGITTQALNVTTGGTYECHVTNGSGCTEVTSVTTVTVNSNPTPAITPSGATTFCLGDDVDLDAGTYVSYLWSTTEATQIITVGANGTYSVTVTDANGCTGTSSSVVVTVDATCCGNPTDNIISSAGAIPANTYTGNKNLNFNGNIATATTVIFDALTLNIAAGISITVNSGALLRIINASTLQACGDMWEGIIVLPGGTLEVTGSTVKDAETALLMDGGGTTTIDGSTFDHNYVGLDLRNHSYSTSNIYGSTFDCTGGVITRAPHNNETALAHVQLQYVTAITIGDPSAQNHINTAKYGILSNTSSFDVINNIFDYSGSDPDAIAICVNSKSMRTGTTTNTLNINASGAYPNTINDWPTGVYSNSEKQITIKSNFFNNNETACTIQLAANSNLVDNTFNNFGTGIRIFNGYSVLQTHGFCCSVFNTITANHFNPGSTFPISRYGNVAIDVQNAKVNHTNVTVSGNDILNSAIGIHAVNSTGIKIIGTNTYDLQIPSIITNANRHIGIWLENCSTAKVANNIIHRSGITPDPNELLYLTGILIENTMRAKVIENHLQELGAGITIHGACKGTELHCNTMLNTYEGMYMNAATLLPQGTPGGTDIAWDNYWDIASAQGGPYKVDGSIVNGPLFWDHQGDDLANVNFSPNPYFGNIINPNPFQSPDPTCDPPLPLMPLMRRSAFGPIIGDSISYSQLEDENKYYDKVFFYESVLENDTIINAGEADDSVYEAAFDAISNSNVGKFAEVSDSISVLNFDVARELLGSIVDSTLIEYNLKVAYGIYLDNFADTLIELDSLQRFTLDSIARQLAVEGGWGVYMARTMLDTNIYDHVSLDTCTKTSAPGVISGPKTGQCGQTGVSFSIIPVSGATSYFWYSSDTNYASISGPSNLSAVSINFADSLNEVVLVVKANNSCGSSYPSAIKVYGRPESPLPISGSVSVCDGSFESYSTSGSAGATSFYWSVPSGATILNSHPYGNSILVFWGGTSGNIEVAAINDCGSSDTIALAVNITCKQSFSNRISNLHVFPNPTTGKLFIELNSLKEDSYSIELTDVTGRVLLIDAGKILRGGNLKELEIGNLSKGIYFINFKSSVLNEVVRVILQ